jgi:putative flippase GtrA
VPRFAVYVLVGAVSAAIDLLTLSILIEVGIKQWSAVTTAFAAGFIFNIKAHSVFTFNSQLNRKSGIRFTAVVAINYLLTLIVIETLTIFSVELFSAKLVSLPIIAVTGYLLGRHWAFKS